MGIEIERKYLVTGEQWRRLIHSSKKLTQGYLSTSAKVTVRVRQEVNLDSKTQVCQTTWLTLKGQGNGITRPEFEYEIPWDDGVEMLSIMSDRRPLEKTRHFVHFGTKVWEIDEFHGLNKGLIVAEVNLTHEAESIELPPWVHIEVSNDPRYLNSHLYENPYQNWRIDK